MGVSAIEARRMTMLEYDQLLSGWEMVHADPDAVEPPTPEEWEAQQKRLRDSPAVTDVSPVAPS